MIELNFKKKMCDGVILNQSMKTVMKKITNVSQQL